MTFIPKVFEVQGLVSVAYLWDEVSLLPPGAELRAKTRAKVVSIMPEFGGFWYEGYKCYSAEARRYCRKPVGQRQGLFKPEDERKWHFHPCERGDIQFWRFKIGVDDTYSKLEGVIWQAAGYLLGDHLDSPYWPLTFQKHFPTEKSQTKYFDALIKSETWFIFDVVYKRNEDLGDFTFTYMKNASKGPNIPMYPTPTGHMKACHPPLFPTSVLQMDPDSKLKKHNTCGSEKAHPDGECILEAPSEYLLKPVKFQRNANGSPPPPRPIVQLRISGIWNVVLLPLQTLPQSWIGYRTNLRLSMCRALEIPQHLVQDMMLKGALDSGRHKGWRKP
ncbi:unnamed protein product [Calypogeia fissa]